MNKFLSIVLICSLGLGLCACKSEIKEDLYQKDDIEKDTKTVETSSEETNEETVDVKEA